MKLLDNFKQKSALKYLFANQHKQARIQKSVNLAKAKSIALLFEIADEQAYITAQKIAESFRTANQKIRVVCYSPYKIDPPFFIPKLQYEILNSTNRNWRYQPVKPFVKDFIEEDFDLVVNLNLNRDLTLLYLLVMSKASIKVGPYAEDLHGFYDLMVHATADETPETFAEQVIRYLNHINT